MRLTRVGGRTLSRVDSSFFREQEEEVELEKERRHWQSFGTHFKAER
jgi:hypothetical protein